MIDPVSLEVIRHRLTTIIEEGATALRNTSGSPTVAMAGDCNVALLDAKGECLLIGRMIAGHALSCISTVRYVINEYGSNPGIGPDDMFISNDPYVSTPHQNCVVVVAPIHHGAELIAWAGAGIHVGDMGGPIPGQCAIGAQSIWEEPSRMPPVRVVEAGVIRKDIEQDFLSRSRTPLTNAMDMRAMIAANNTMKRRLQDIVARYDVGTVVGVMGEMLTIAESRLRGILREVADGAWEQTAYLDYHDHGEDMIYACRLRMAKDGDRLSFDFSGSSAQAPAVINASMAALRANVLSPLIAFFSYAIGASPGAIFRVIDVTAPPGTIVNCQWPAGMSKGTSAVVQTVSHLVASCVSQMMSTSESHRHRAFTIRGHMPTADVAGTDHHGDAYSGVLPRVTQALGSGARYARDGIDTGGASEPENAIPNIETNEVRFPVLYLYRRQAPDTAGPGAYRGGAGPDIAFVPHDVSSIPSITFHVHGVLYPSALGLFGGYPGATNEVVILRESNVKERFAAGVIPMGREALTGEVDIPPLFGRSALGERDVYTVLGCGGGGYGDPIDRQPALVADDVRKGIVSAEWAFRVYGVAVMDDGSVDADRTDRRRSEIREERRAGSAVKVARADGPWDGHAESAGRISDHLELVRLDSTKDTFVRCSCGFFLGPPMNYRHRFSWQEVECSRRGPHYMQYVNNASFRFRELYCPSCYRLHEVEAIPVSPMGVHFVPVSS